MMPTLNNLLFFIASLFGLNHGFIPSYTSVVIDRDLQSVEVTYHHLKTDGRLEEEMITSTLSQLESTTDFERSEYSVVNEDMSLSSLSVFKEGNEVSVKIVFSYKDEKQLFRSLSFNALFSQNTENNNKDVNIYELLEDERFMKSNGKKKKVEGATQIFWKSTERQMSYTIKRNPKSEEWFKKYNQAIGPFWHN